MLGASTRYVNLDELHLKAGDRIARLLGAEAALVTAGCASALTLATAACIAGDDEDRIRLLPDTTGMKNEVILQAAHRNSYDHAVRNAGARLVEVGTAHEMKQRSTIARLCCSSSTTPKTTVRSATKSSWQSARSTVCRP